MATARRASHLSRLHSQTPGKTKNMPVLKAMAYALRCSISRQLITKFRSNIPIISTEWSILGTTMPKRRSPGAKYIDSIQNLMTEIDYQLYVQGRDSYAGCHTPPDDPLLPPGRVIFGYMCADKNTKLSDDVITDMLLNIGIQRLFEKIRRTDPRQIDTNLGKKTTSLLRPKPRHYQSPKVYRLKRKETQIFPLNSASHIAKTVVTTSRSNRQIGTG